MATTKKTKPKPKSKPNRNPVGSGTKKTASRPKPAPKVKTSIKAGAATSNTLTSPRIRHDWEAVERDYRTGKFTLQELEAKHGPSYETISRKAKELGWKKDLRGAIAQATAIIVAEASSKQAQESVKETIAQAAELNRQVIIGHRTDIVSVRDTAFEMLQELRQVNGTMQELREFIANLEELQIGAIEADEDMGRKEKDRRIKRLLDEYDRLRKMTFEAADIHNRIGSAKALADTLVKLQGLERKAFGLDDKEDDGRETYEKVLDSILD